MPIIWPSLRFCYMGELFMKFAQYMQSNSKYKVVSVSLRFFCQILSRSLSLSVPVTHVLDFFFSTSAQPRHYILATLINGNTSCCRWRCCTGTAPTLGSFWAKESRSSPSPPRRNSRWKMQIVSCRMCQPHTSTWSCGNPVWPWLFSLPFSSVYRFRD